MFQASLMIFQYFLRDTFFLLISYVELVFIRGGTKSTADVSGLPHSRAHPGSTIATGHMTREELERHLDSKQNVFGIEKATASLPMDIFSNDNSNHAR
jgi:hypothetical protein